MGSIEKFKTVNQLKIEEQKVFLDKYFKARSNVINHYFNVFERRKIKTGLLKLFYQFDNEIRPKYKEFPTKVCFSTQPYNIPLDLFLMTALFVNLDLSVKGIFRVNSTKTRIEECMNAISEIEEKQNNPYDSFDKLKLQFTAIDVGESLKRLLKNFNNPVLPNSFISVIVKIIEPKPEHEIIILTKAFVIGLPPINRRILETVIYICTYLVSYNDISNHNNRLDIYGLSVTLVPTLFHLEDPHIEMNVLESLIKFVHIIFKHYRAILSCEI